MLISKKNRKRLWKRVVVGIIIPSALSYGLAYGQEATPAPAVQEIPMKSMDDNIPPPPADGVVNDEAPGKAPDAAPAVAAPGRVALEGCGPNRACCTSDGVACGPRAAGCQADTIVCTPKGATGACGPAGKCGPAGSCGPAGTCRVSDTCKNGLCGPTAGCQTGMAQMTGICADGSCMTGYGYPCNGMACMGSPDCSLSPEVCMGRPYTIGDLKRSWFGAKCRCKNYFGTNGCNSCSPLHEWWTNQQYKSSCRRAYRNHVLAAHFHNKFNYFKPSGCCGEGCPPFGCYKRVYATKPHYSDARDSQVYASPMTGLPMAVPLPPTVRHQYNYSWGMPSSRLTPISNIVLPHRH